jgi:hypothetical protein
MSTPQAYLCLTRQEPSKVFIVSEHIPTAEQTALKFKSVYHEKLRILNPGIFPPNIFQLPPGFPQLLPQAAAAAAAAGLAGESVAKPTNFVAKGFLFAGRANVAEDEQRHVDLFELYEDLISLGVQGVMFDPDVYPALIWLEEGKSPEAPQVKTIIYPSGIMAVHGSDSAETLVDVYQRKLPYLMKFLR